MKTSRKGFTLVELLIVVAILATLTATMTYSVSGSTAKAKAAAIANNVEAMKTAGALCVATNGEVLASDKDITSATADDVLKKYLAAWIDFKQDGTVVYAPSTVTGSTNWAVKVDFSADNEKDDIKTALQKIKGYGKYDNNGTVADVMPAADTSNSTPASYSFEVYLLGGTIKPVTDGNYTSN